MPVCHIDGEREPGTETGDVCHLVHEIVRNVLVMDDGECPVIETNDLGKELRAEAAAVACNAIDLKTPQPRHRAGTGRQFMDEFPEHLPSRCS